ncbi:hypothetical protein [Pseudomonas japonica]|uniref:hypothetical protein n=1 Tax=Pseudomonas japonica TaxID=256466 RepID=UPI00069431E0|nr:hypothetical protein [Pseudomonas japonica]
MHTGQRNRAAIVNCAYELRHYLLTARDVEIHQVQMMCPPSISGQNQWVLSELDSITLYSGVDTNETAMVYRAKGQVYKLGELDLRKRKTARTFYTSAELSQRVTEASECRPPVNNVSLYSYV